MAVTRVSNPDMLKIPDFRFPLLLICFTLVLSLSSISQELQQKITLRMSDKSISEVLKEISKKSKIDFSYNPQMVPVDRHITIHAKNKPVVEILEEVLIRQGIGYTIVENHLVLKRMVNPELLKEQCSR
jgi:hypothetical protein